MTWSGRSLALAAVLAACAQGPLAAGERRANPSVAARAMAPVDAEAGPTAAPDSRLGSAGR